MNDLANRSPEIIVSQVGTESQTDHYKWLLYFDPRLALQDFINYLETLPSSRTPERATYRVYMSSLADFFRYMGANVISHGHSEYTFDFDTMAFPSLSAVQAYISYGLQQGRCAKTVARYLAAVRLYLKILETQDIAIQNGSDFVYLWQALQQIRLAVKVQDPRDEVSTNRPALENHGTRLNLSQVNQLFGYFEDKMDTLAGKRDLTILYLGITSGLRAAEISRITLDSIRQGDSCWEIKVRGKRSNYDPIGIDNEAHDLIMQWVNAFNEGLAEDDPRRITGDTPIFQPLRNNSHRGQIGAYDPKSGISARAILMLVKKHAEAALKFQIGAHDMRRTCAYLMRNHGFEWEEIRTQLRHKSIATTEKYVGKYLDLSRSLITNRVHFNVPHLSGGAA